MTGTRVDTDIADGVAWITLDGHARRNALDAAAAQNLVAACDRVDGDASVGVAVITGAGGAFCSGADTAALDRVRTSPPDQAYEGLEELYSGFRRVLELRVPVVAAVDGAAIGAGLNLALAADLRIATTNAVFVSGFAPIGIHPGGGHLHLLARAAGPAAAAALGVFGQRLPAPAAFSCGLVTEVVEPAELRTPCPPPSPTWPPTPTSPAPSRTTCAGPSTTSPAGTAPSRSNGPGRCGRSPAAPPPRSSDVPSSADRRRPVRVDRKVASDIEALAQAHRGELDDANAHNEFPRRAYQALGRLGYVGPLVPTQWGGLGGGVREYVVINEEVARHGMVTPQVAIQGQRWLLDWGTDAQKDQWLRGIATGELVFSESISEKQAGSSFKTMQATAVRDGDAWVLNGSKCHVNMGADCDVTLFYAVAPEGLTSFLVDMHLPGIRTEVSNAIGFGSSAPPTSADDVRVSEADLLGPAGGGLQTFLSTFNVSRLGNASELIGFGRRALELALRYATDRRSGTARSPTSRASSGWSPTRGPRCTRRPSPATTRPWHTSAARRSRCTPPSPSSSRSRPPRQRPRPPSA